MRRAAVGVVAVVLAAAACAGPLPPVEPISELSVGRLGGVAGVREVLRVQPDGLAVVTSPVLAAGRLDEERTARLRTVLGSAELRREVRDAGRREPGRACADQFGRSLEMGSLAMSVTDPCRGEGPRTPAFDEVLALLADARVGRFDVPLRTDDVAPVTVRVARPGTAVGPGRTIDVDVEGTATLTRPGAEPVRVALLEGQRAAAALVADGLLGRSLVTCPPDSRWTLAVEAADGRTVEGSSCAFAGREVDARTLVDTLDRLFVGR